MEKTVVIEGMGCQNCVRHVTEALKKVPGVSSVNVDLATGQAAVETDNDDDQALRDAVSSAGYTPVAIR